MDLLFGYFEQTYSSSNSLLSCRGTLGKYLGWLITWKIVVVLNACVLLPVDSYGSTTPREDANAKRQICGVNLDSIALDNLPRFPRRAVPDFIAIPKKQEPQPVLSYENLLSVSDVPNNSCPNDGAGTAGHEDIEHGCGDGCHVLKFFSMLAGAFIGLLIFFLLEHFWFGRITLSDGPTWENKLWGWISSPFKRPNV